ncbi:hypothetical protein DPMN_076146 [Dreissena polymorpha]|uniref:Uncharacterized protein n=1 Tax=Dreissena polymorpha TaxID=45954 RepID=A0A9D4BN56_DREPO|nr:hypothetical protein DPMN_076146 [Dreissena polymorpha]
MDYHTLSTGGTCCRFYRAAAGGRDLCCVRHLDGPQTHLQRLLALSQGRRRVQSPQSA